MYCKFGFYVVIVFLSSYCLEACYCCDCEGESVEVNDKVFSNANENGAADVFLDRLHRTIGDLGMGIQETVFILLIDKLNRNCLPEGIGASVNDRRLSIANEAIIVDTLLTTVRNAYYRYRDFVLIKRYDVEKFREVFIRFLKVVEKMIISALANYIVKTRQNVPVDDLFEDNLFSLEVHKDISSFLNIRNSLELRNAVEKLFCLTFGKIVYDYISSLNNLNENEIKEHVYSLDSLTMVFRRND
ncbi:MAG: hypothetical protein II393_04595 [Cytophagales bacterium]|nr:hypothetical protein [Cytophagales bacterium]